MLEDAAMAEVEVCYLEAGGGGGCRSRREAAEVVVAALFPLATLQHQAKCSRGRKRRHDEGAW